MKLFYTKSNRANKIHQLRQELKVLMQRFQEAREEESCQSCQFLIDPLAPTWDFDGRKPSWQEIQEVVKRARSSSAPGPSGVPHKVYKNCPKSLHRHLEGDLEEGEGC